MKIEIIGKNHMIVRREAGDARIGRESTLFHHIRNTLRKMGHDVVRQVPAKDGHMFSAPYYIRQRKGAWCAYDNFYALRDLAQTYRETGEARLDIQGDIDFLKKAV